MNVQHKRLGTNGPATFPLIFGCAALSGSYGQVTDDAERIATIREAIDRGVTMFDTADFYGSGHNELLIAKAIQGRREQVQISLKFGALRGPDGKLTGIDGRPQSVRNFLAYSMTRLGVDVIDIYRPARLDPDVPIEETIGAMADLVKAGYVRHIGLSEVGPDTIRRAHAVHPICDLQIEYSLVSRNPEHAIFPVLDELGIAVTAYAVLSHGLLSGTVPQAGQGDIRTHLPRFSGENFERNRKLVEALSEIAHGKGVSNAQLAIAWVLARGANIVPVIGCRNRSQLRDTLGALDIALSSEEMAHLEHAVPASEVAGSRYDERYSAMLDSEKPAAQSMGWTPHP